MRKIQLIIQFLLVLTFNSSFTQVNVGKSRSPINLYVSGLSKKDFNFVKSTKTYFVVPEDFNFEEFSFVIEPIWTFNEIAFVEQQEFDDHPRDYIAEGNSIIQLIDDAYKKVKTNFGTGESRDLAEYIAFKLRMDSYKEVTYKKKGKIKADKINVAEVFFTPSISFRQGTVRLSNRMVFFGKNENEEPNFYNFTLGYIKNYFQVLNARLVAGENLKIRDGILNKSKLKELKNKVLFMPEWMLMKYNALNITEAKKRTAEELFNKYKFNYKIMANEDLNNKILNGEDFYYLMHTQFNQVKIISIINSRTGEIIYLKEESSYNLKPSDLKKISNLIQ